LLPLVERRCYLGRHWLTGVQTHTHARAKCCTLGGLPASLFFPSSFPPLRSYMVPSVPTHAHRYTRERERAFHILHALAQYFHPWRPMYGRRVSACISLRAYMDIDSLSSVRFYDSRTETARNCWPRENPLLMPWRVGTERNSGRSSCTVRNPFGIQLLRIVRILLRISYEPIGAAMRCSRGSSAIQATRLIGYVKLVSHHRQD